MKVFSIIVTIVLVLAGLALLLPGASQWQYLQILAALGNPDPLYTAASKMAVGMLCLAGSWGILRYTRNR